MQQIQFDFAQPRKSDSSLRDHPIFQEVEPHVFAQFKRFHEENPDIYSLFKRFAYELKERGRKNYGAKAIMERIRWHVYVETSGSEFKISNSVTSCYPRLLILDDPSFEDFFRRCRRHD